MYSLVEVPPRCSTSYKQLGIFPPSQDAVQDRRGQRRQAAADRVPADGQLLAREQERGRLRVPDVAGGGPLPRSHQDPARVPHGRVSCGRLCWVACGGNVLCRTGWTTLADPPKRSTMVYRVLKLQNILAPAGTRTLARTSSSAACQGTSGSWTSSLRSRCTRS